MAPTSADAPPLAPWVVEAAVGSDGRPWCLWSPWFDGFKTLFETQGGWLRDKRGDKLEDTMAPTLAEVPRGTKGRRGCRRRRWSQCAPRALVEAAVPVPVALKCLQRHCLGACRFCRWLVVADA